MEALKRTILLAALLLSGAAEASEHEISHIEISGLEYSDARVVMRELPFQEGDIWQPVFAETGARRLRNLGLFSDADISPPDAAGVVHIRVNGRWPFWILPEASRSDLGATSAGVALTEYNMWGLHHHLRLAMRRDTGKNFTGSNDGDIGSYQAYYIWRRVNDSKFDLDLSVNNESSIYDAYRNSTFSSSYLQENRNWSAGIRYGFGAVPSEGWALRFGFSTDKTVYSLRNGPALADFVDHRSKALQFSANYRMVDDRITWLTGSEIDYEAEMIPKVLGSTMNSYKQTISWRRHLEIGNQNTLGYRINAGLRTGNAQHDALFDLGNRNGFRGYYPGDLQGSGYIYGSLEGRHPLTIDSNVQLVAFVDAGHVRLDGRSALGRPVIVGIGGGARWTLRWLVNGTLRLDGAYGFATGKWRLYLGTGQAF